MALTQRSLFLYGLEVTELNSSIDFRAVALEDERQATLRLGFYSLSSLATEIKRAMQAADPSRTYTVSVDRTLSGGLQNRVTIATNGSHLELLFSSGTRAGSSVASLIGFAATDRTGATSYTGTSTCGTAFSPTHVGYNYIPPDIYQEVFGNVNVSASGVKEAIVFNIQQFWQVEFKFETYANVISSWKPLMQWAIRQRLLEFTPDVTAPSTVYEGTLEKTDANGKGLSFKMSEMLPNFPNLYKTGLLTFRVKN